MKKQRHDPDPYIEDDLDGLPAKEVAKIKKKAKKITKRKHVYFNEEWNNN
jgi:hypothetical protein